MSPTPVSVPSLEVRTPLPESAHPLISVLIPLYNRQDYIDQTLDSLLDDRYPHKEIVVIDDGSTDGSYQKVQDWAAAHPEIPVRVKTRPNRGVAKTTWELIDWAQGQIVVFMDSDDRLLRDGIQLRYDFLREHPDVWMVFSDCILIDHQGRQIADSGLQEIGKVDCQALAAGEDIQKFAILNGFTTGSTQMIDKRLFSQVEGLADIQFSQDWILMLQGARVNRLAYCPGKVSAYRIHPADDSPNISTSPYQYKVLYENFLYCIRTLPLFPGLRLKYYVFLQILHCALHLPYLALKLKLAQQVRQSGNSASGRLARQLLDGLTGLKVMFRQMTSGLFLKHRSDS